MVICRLATQTEHSLATSVISKPSDSACGDVPAHRFPAGKAAAIVFVVCALSLTWVFRRPWFEGNLGVVDAGRVIRSAQPTSQLPRLIEELQSQVDPQLAGGNPADSWYDAEVRTAQTRDLAFYDLPLSATRRPTRRELLNLIDILRRCPYPLLIHCKSGADRTGLASAIYLMTAQRGTTRTGRSELFRSSLATFPLGGTRTSARTAERIRRLAQGQSAPAHGPTDFATGSRTTTDPATPRRPTALADRPATASVLTEVDRTVCFAKNSFLKLSGLAGSIKQVARPDLLKLRQLIVPAGHDCFNRLAGKDLLIGGPVAKQAEQSLGLPVVGIHATGAGRPASCRAGAGQTRASE